MLKVKDGYAKVIGTTYSGSSSYLLLSNGGLKAIGDFATSGHNHDSQYLKLTGGTMTSTAYITFADSGSWGAGTGALGARGGLSWSGQSDWVKLYAEETASDNLDLIIKFGDDNSNGLSIRNNGNAQTTYISANGVLTTNTLKGNLDWSYITNKPSFYTKAESDSRYLTNITTAVNKLTFTKNGGNTDRDITVNVVKSLGRRNPLDNRNSISGIYTYGTYSNSGNLAPSSYFETLGFGEGASGTIEIGGCWVSGGLLYWRALRDTTDNWFSWKTILDSSNYSSILDSRYYTESEINTKLATKLDRVNLTTGNWNPRGYNLAAGYHYNGGNVSFAESSGLMHISIDGKFWLNEGLYRVLDTSDVNDLRSNLTILQYISNSDNAWYPLIWGGGSHKNTNNSTGQLYKSHDVLSWQTSSQTLYTTKLLTTDITFPNSGTSLRGIQGTVGDNDFWRIKGGATASNSGFLEIATADDGNEPIYIRQYTGVFGTVKRTLTLLDGNGFSYFPSYINIGGNENNNSSPDRVWGSNGSDSFLRSYRTSALSVANAHHLYINGSNSWSNWYWSGQGGLPSWLWGSNDGTNMYVWNPSNFRVAYANSAGNADTVDGWHKDNIQWTGYITSGTANLSSYWFKMYDVTITNKLYNDITLTFLLSDGYLNCFSIFHLRIRQNTGSAPYNFSINLRELVGNCSDKIVVYYNNNTGNILLWGNVVGLWGVLNYTVIKKTERCSQDFTSLGTLTALSFSSVLTQPSSGYTKVTMSKLGLVLTADKLQSVRTLWGQRFDGTNNVSGTLSNVNHILFSSDNAYDIGTNTNASRYIYTHWIGSKSGLKLEIGANNSSYGLGICIDTNLKVGIGTNSPSYKLDVRGDTKITGSIRDLAIGGGIYWNPYVESTSAGSDAASITVVKSGVAGGTTLVLSLLNDSNDTIQFLTNGAARLYHNSNLILTSGDSSVSGGGSSWGSSITVKINNNIKTLTIPGNPNTWRPITDSYSGTSTSTSLSLKGANDLYKTLYEGPAKRLLVNNEFAKGNNFLLYFNAANMTNPDAIGNAAPDSDWWHIIRMNHGNTLGFFSELAIALNSYNGVYWRTIGSGVVKKSWTRLANANEILNPTNYYWANVKVSSTSSTTTSPTVNVLTATRVCAGYDSGITNAISCSGWFRSSGNTGWYNATYAGGWYMSDSTWVRSHANKGVYTGGSMRASSLEVLNSNRSVQVAILDSSNNLVIGLDTTYYSPLVTTYVRGNSVNFLVKNGSNNNYTAFLVFGNLSLSNNFFSMKAGAEVSDGNFTAYNSTYLAISTGSVGIGTISPNYKLEVNGEVMATGFRHTAHNDNDAVLLAGGGFKTLNTIGFETYLARTDIIIGSTHYGTRLNLDFAKDLPLINYNCIVLLDNYTINPTTRRLRVELTEGFDGLIVFLKDTGDKTTIIYFNDHAPLMPANTNTTKSTFGSANGNTDFDDGKSRILVYSKAKNCWIEYYCG